MASLQDSKKALQLSQNIKKTALGTKFVKTLFTSPESLNAKSTTLILKQLGLEIPEGVLIANDAAQVIVSGQAISDGLDAGKSFSDMQNSVSVTASIGSATNGVTIVSTNPVIDILTQEVIPGVSVGAQAPQGVQNGSIASTSAKPYYR